MAIEFNHTIVHAYDKQESAKFLADILGLPSPKPFGPYFLVVHMNNGVSLDFIETTDKIEPQHYAFLVSEGEFDQIFTRVINRGLTYWADPAKKTPGQINTHFGGRGFYFDDPSGNFMEVITKPYSY